jgi:hypothetical protein
MQQIEIAAADPVPYPATEPLEYLQARIRDGVAEYEQSVRESATVFLTTSERCVRLGWALQDAYQIVKNSSGCWNDWVAKLPLSIERCKRLRRFGGFFTRDLVDYQERRSRGFEIVGLEAAIGDSLQQQLLATGAKSQNQLLRLLGLKSASATQACAQPKRRRPKALPPAQTLSQNGDAPYPSSSNGVCEPEFRMLPSGEIQPLAKEPIKRLVDSLKEVQKCLGIVNFYETSPVERREVTALIAPIVRAFTVVQAL